MRAFRDFVYTVSGHEAGVSTRDVGMATVPTEGVYKEVVEVSKPRSMSAQEQLHTMSQMGLSEDFIVEQGAEYLQSVGLIETDSGEIINPIDGERYSKSGGLYYSQDDPGKVIHPSDTRMAELTAEFLSRNLSDAQLGSLMSDPENGAIVQNRMRERAAVTSQLGMIQHKLMQRVEDEGIAGLGADFAGYLLPVFAWFANTASTGDTVTPGTVLQDFVEAFPTDSFEKQMATLATIDKSIEEGGNTLALLSAVDWLQSQNVAELNVEAASDVLEVIGLGQTIKFLGRGAKVGDLLSLTKSTKARAAEADKVVVAPPSNVEDSMDALGLVLPSSLQADSLQEVSVGTKATKKLKEAQADAVAALRGRISTRLTEEEVAAAAAPTVRRIYRELNLGLPVEEDLLIEGIQGDLSTGRFVVQALVGKGNDELSGFSSELAARKHAADSLGMEEGFFGVVEKDSQWFLTVERNLEEEGIIKAGSKALLHDNFVAGAPILNKIAGFKSVGDMDIVSQFALARGAEERVRKAANNFAEIINKVPGKHRNDLEEVIALGRQRERWFSEADLDDVYRDTLGRPATNKEKAAYLAYRQISDMNYTIMDNKVVNELTANGYQEFLVKDVSGTQFMGNGKAVDVAAIDTPGRQRFQIGDEVYGIGDMTEEGLVSLNDEGFKVVKLDQPRNFGDGEVDFVVFDADQGVNFRPIRSGQLSYVEGGPRIYSGDFFVKQANVEGGVKFNDKTIFNLSLQSDAIKVADEYNDALEMYQIAKTSGRADDIAEATEVISRNTRFNGFEDFNSAMEKGLINDKPFEVVRSGAKTKFGETEGSIFKRDDAYFEYSDGVKDLMQGGKMFYSQRGDHLLHPKEGLAEVLDPFTSMSVQSTHAVREFAYGDFKARQVERWLDSAGNNVVSDGNKVSTALFGEIREGQLSAKELHELTRSRQLIKQAIHTPTIDQRASQRLTERLVEIFDVGLDGTFVSGLGKTAAKKLSGSSLDPVQAVKSINFNMMLGLGDWSQLFVQTSMMPAVLAVSPKNGAKAVGLYRHLRKVQNNPTIIKEVAKRQSILPEQDFIDLAEDVRQHGLNVVGSTQAQLDNFSDAAEVKHSVTRWTGKAVEKSRFFFNEAEGFNLTVANVISWLDNGGTKIKSAEAARRFASRAEVLGGNMTRSGNAIWQQGPTGMMTQFAAHPFRVGEIIMADQAGGLSKAERARYAAALSLTYGAAGTVGGEWAYNKLNEGLGRAPTKEEHATVMQGMYGAMFPDTDFSRLAPFAQKNLLGKLMDPETKLWDLFFGPTYNLWKAGDQVLEGAVVVSALMAGNPQMERLGVLKHTQPVDVAQQMFKDFFKHVASTRRGVAMYTALKTGEYYSSNGVLLEDNLSTLEAVFVGAGLPPTSVREAFEGGFGAVNNKDRKEFIELAGKRMAGLFIEAREAKSDEERLEKLSLAYAYGSVMAGKARHGDEVHQDTVEAIRIANKYMKPESIPDKFWRQAARDLSINADDVYIYTPRDKKEEE
jgi:hypothetical protein